MSIKYKVVKLCQPGVIGGGKYKYYPRIYDRRKIKFDEISHRISNISTLSSIDIAACLEAFTNLIPELLQENRIVVLGDLGTFSLHIRSTASVTEKEVNRTNINDVKIAFRASNRTKGMFKLAKFSREV